MEKIKKNIHNWLSTLFGLIVAVVMAWQMIDWDSFSFKKDWIKLVMSGIPAIGGYLTQFKKPKENDNTNS
mgnify:CR=1 FL=1